MFCLLSGPGLYRQGKAGGAFRGGMGSGLPSAHEGYYKIANSLQWRVPGQAGQDAGREAGNLPRSVTLIPFFSIINKAINGCSNLRSILAGESARRVANSSLNSWYSRRAKLLHVRATPCHIYCGRSRGTHSFSGPLLHPHHPIHPTPRSRCYYPRKI